MGIALNGASSEPLRSGGIWRNWSGSVVASPAAFAEPASEAELAEVIRQATVLGLRVRAVGAGHSFSDAAETSGVLVSLDRMRGLVRVERSVERTVERTVEPDNGVTPNRRTPLATAHGVEAVAVLRAGTRLHELPALLAPHGLALANQGDIDRQSLAGAISTGTHGTGLAFTGLAAMVRSLRIVTADGSTLELSGTSHPELFDVARLSLGALGIVTEIGIACVPAFELVADEQAADLDETIATFAERCREVDHTEFFWFPQTDRALVKSNRRVAPGATLPDGFDAPPLGRARRLLDEELVNNGVLELACRVGRAVPATVLPINRLATSLISGRRYRGTGHDVFVSPRRVRFNEMEYGVPLDDVAEVLREVRRRITDGGWRVSFPVEVRAAAADDVPLSTAFGRETAYIAVHRYAREPFAAFFADIEPVLVAAGGRPHWGKRSTLTAVALRERYPRFDEFVAVRDRLDPDRRFGGPLLERMLGA